MSDTTTITPTPGEPFPCPECGSNDWKADYLDPAWQTVVLVAGDDGGPEIGDYTGTSGYYDDSTPNESYTCRECEHVISLGQHVFIPADGGSLAEVAGWLSNAWTALTDPEQVDTDDMTEHVATSDALDSTYGEAAPSPLTLYAVDQLDQAINRLRAIYDPDEVAAES